MKEVVRILIDINFSSGRVLGDLQLDLEIELGSKVSISETVMRLIESEKHIKLKDRDKTFIVSTKNIEYVEIFKAFRI